MTEIKPWQDRVKPGAFTGVKMEAMLAEIAEHRAARVEQGEPVAWIKKNGSGDLITISQDRLDKLTPEFAYIRDLWKDATPLFTHPVRQMSDEQIDQIWMLNGGGLAANRYHDFARAIEAHIKGATE